jgi:ABC-type polysaccharide/polyol phosphate transport system ATPase subunit
MTDQPLIKLDNVGKQFSKGFQHGHRTLGRELLALFFGGKPAAPRLHDPEAFWALQDVSFEVRRGEVLAVIGHNGAGKTTLLRMLNGEFGQDRGQLTVSGQRSSLIDLTAGFSMNMSGRENIYFRGAHLGFDRSFLRRKEAEILAFAELDDFIDSPIKTYSSGMLLRLGFAVTVFAEPDVLLMDEVLSVGDFLFEQKCMNRINQLRERCAVVIVTHGMGTVANFADRCLLLDRGLPVFLGGPVEAIEAYYKLEAEKQRNGLRLSRAAPRIAVEQLLANPSAASVAHPIEEQPAAGPLESPADSGVSPEVAAGEPPAAFARPLVSPAEPPSVQDETRASADAALRPSAVTVYGPLFVSPADAADATVATAPPGADNGAIGPDDLPPLARASMYEFLHSHEAVTEVTHRWLTESGAPAHTLSGADSVTLRIEFTARRRLRRLVVGVPVWSEEGVFITAFGTHARSITRDLEPGHHVIELRIPAIRLNRGTYYPVVAILDQHEFIYRWPTTPLVVTLGAEVLTWGLVTLDYHWEQPGSTVRTHKRFSAI